MTTKTSYRPGEPIWADLSTPDPAASAAFYGALLGWQVAPPQEDMGGYTTFLLDDRKVAGLVPVMSPEQPPTWTCYVCTHDAEQTAALVQQSGGTTMVAPMTVADLGRMAVFVDPAGAVFGVWQPGTHTGADLVDEPGAQTWFELTAPEPAEAVGFYGPVLGWEAKTSDSYVEFVLGGTAVAGCADPSQGTTGWLPYFAVTDPAVGAAQAEALGGSVVLPCTSFPGGSCAIVRDPHGATLGLLTTS